MASSHAIIKDVNRATIPESDPSVTSPAFLNLSGSCMRKLAKKCFSIDTPLSWKKYLALPHAIIIVYNYE